MLSNMLDVPQIVPDAVSPENKRQIREIFVDIMENERTSGGAGSMKDLRHEGITWMMNLFARGAVLHPDHPSAAEWLDLAKYKDGDMDLVMGSMGHARSIPPRSDVTLFKNTSPRDRAGLQLEGSNR